jgi:hypothetical protein
MDMGEYSPDSIRSLAHHHYLVYRRLGRFIEAAPFPGGGKPIRYRAVRNASAARAPVVHGNHTAAVRRRRDELEPARAGPAALVKEWTVARRAEG